MTMRKNTLRSYSEYLRHYYGEEPEDAIEKLKKDIMIAIGLQPKDDQNVAEHHTWQASSRRA